MSAESRKGVGCVCGWPLDSCNPAFAKGKPCDKKRIEAEQQAEFKVALEKNFTAIGFVRSNGSRATTMASITDLYECSRCGDAVSNRAQHERWHRAEANRIRSGSREPVY